MSVLKNVDPIDEHIGTRLRNRRVLAGLTQTQLAKVTGISHQQLQKYESGQNRISPCRLLSFSAHLGVNVQYFFDGLGQESDVSATKCQDNKENLFRRESIELLKSYYRLDAATRKKLGQMVRGLADIVSPLPEGTPKRGRPRKNGTISRSQISEIIDPQAKSISIK